MEINFVVSYMTALYLTSVFVFIKTPGAELRLTQLYMKKHTVCCSLPTSTSIHILEGLPSKQYQVHQQRAPDLCGPTSQLITRYTPILDSRSQTSALK